MLFYLSYNMILKSGAEGGILSIGVNYALLEIIKLLTKNYSLIYEYGGLIIKNYIKIMGVNLDIYNIFS